jgi:RNA polymerase sigma-70 factor, ECF subfamily
MMGKPPTSLLPLPNRPNGNELTPVRPAGQTQVATRDLTAEEESKLLANCRQGDLKSYEPIVKMHQPRIVRLAFQILRDEHLAEEASHTTFIRVWQKLGKFDGRSSFSTWTHRLCVNICYDIMRARKRQESRFSRRPWDDSSPSSINEPPNWELIASPSLSPDSEAGNQEMFQAVLKALDSLPEDQRLAIILKEMQGLEHREIAAIMGCPEGTVMSRLFHARKKLREILRKIF